MPSEKVQKIIDLKEALDQAIVDGAPLETCSNLRKAKTARIEALDVAGNYEYQLHITAQEMKLDALELDLQVTKDAKTDDPSGKLDCLMHFKMATLSLMAEPFGFLGRVNDVENEDDIFDLAPPKPSTLH